MSSINRKLANIISNTGDVKKAALNNGASMEVYDSVGALPTAGLTSGDQAFVESAGGAGTSRLYISNGSGWYNVAVVNATPRLTLSSEGTIALASDGTATTITMTALDSDNANLTLSLESGGDLFKFATVSRDSSVVTITPRSEDSATTLGYDGSATLTFKATDGISIASVQNTFTLSFGADWSNTPSVNPYVVYGDVANMMWGNGASAVSSDGSYSAVCEYGLSKIEIFYSSNLTTWALQQEIDGSEAGVSTSRSGNFGANKNVSLDDAGERIAIGDHGSDLVYIYKRTGTSWAFEAEITPGANSELYGQYGWSCALSGDGLYLVIGDRTSTGDDYGGQVSVWLRTGTNWARQAKFSQPSSSSNYGNAVDISKNGDYVVVGDWTYNSDTGRAYIYKRSGTSWALEATLNAGNAGSGDRFGIQVAIDDDGDTAAVGAHYEDTGNTSAGLIYVFSRSGSTWSEQATLGPNVNAANNYFGQSFDISGDGNIIAGHRQNSSVYSIDVFDRDGTSWTFRRNLAKIGTEAYSGGLNGDVKFSRDGKVIVAGAGNQNNPTGPVSRTGGLYHWKAG
jgi:hypothetical protein